LAHHRPGWIARQRAAKANPVRIAGEIQQHAVKFLSWLKLPRKQRWDTFELQALSAILFSRYRAAKQRNLSPALDVELLALHWPPDGAEIRQRVTELQNLLAAPFSVFKALRLPVDSAECPTPEEVRLAETMLEDVAKDLARAVANLDTALRQYKLNQPIAARALRETPSHTSEAAVLLKPPTPPNGPVCPAKVVDAVAAG
jgi:hypothetical protein